jgi:hypothetical protein
MYKPTVIGNLWLLPLCLLVWLTNPQMSSAAGKVPGPGQAVYSASKHALNGYFASLRSEVSKFHMVACIVLLNCFI